ncbi:MAG: helix-turn-helix transcriptional regulator, partial [Actinomycetota bacterium]|nr:helix-turn-helix transcriptional regulator [Actinomycetota bacterium]
YQDAMGLMRAEYRRALTLEDVARRIATSPRQLQRAFEEAGAPPFAQCLTSVRMERAAELLRETDWPVIDVATAVGYSRHSAFTKAFRRRHGVAPSVMRGRRLGDLPPLAP